MPTVQSKRRPSADPPLSMSLPPMSTAAAFGSSPPNSRSRSAATSPRPRATSPLSRPASPELAEPLPIPFSLQLSSFEGSGDASAPAMQQGSPSYASRYVMPLLRGGPPEAGEWKQEVRALPARPAATWEKAARTGGDRLSAPALPHAAPRRPARLASFFDLPEIPYWDEVKRLAALVPSEVVGIAGLVPTAWTNAQNTRYGLRRWLLFRDLARECEQHLAALGATPQPADDEERRRAHIEARAAREGRGESAFFLSFNVVEHASVALTALPLCLRLLGSRAGARAAAATLRVGTPTLMALHAGFHLLRHVVGLSFARDVRRGAAMAATDSLPPAARERLAALSARERRTRILRGVWLGAWLAFEVGLLLSCGAIFRASVSALWAGALLGASIAATKALEWAFGADVEAPLSILWPGEASRAPEFDSLRWRAFGTLADNARAATCLHEQRQIIADMEASLWPRVPRVRAWVLRAVMGLGNAPMGPMLLDALSGRWLVPLVPAATPVVMRAHEAFWRCQHRLLAEEREQRHDPAPPPADVPAGGGAAEVGSPDAGTAEPPASLKAQALGILLCRPRQALADVDRALTWGGQVTLSCRADTVGQLPAPFNAPVPAAPPW